MKIFAGLAGDQAAKLSALSTVFSTVRFATSFKIINKVDEFVSSVAKMCDDCFQSRLQTSFMLMLLAMRPLGSLH